MGIFGWSLPPGVTHSMIEAQCEGQPCEVCGEFEEDCVCPICPRCGQQGDPNCYKEVDLGICGELWQKETPRQKLGKARFDMACLKEQMQDLDQYIGYLEEQVRDSGEPK